MPFGQVVLNAPGRLAGGASLRCVGGSEVGKCGVVWCGDVGILVEIWKYCNGTQDALLHRFASIAADAAIANRSSVAL